MKKIIHKIAGLALGLSLAMGVGVVAAAHSSKETTIARAETNASWTASGQGYSNAQVIASANIDSVASVTFDKGSASSDCAYYNTGSAVRIYKGASFTVSVSEGKLTSIELNYVFNGSATISCNDASGWDADNKTWSGSRSSVTWTAGTDKHVRLSSISVVYTSEGGGETDPVLQSISISGEQTEYNVGDEFVKPTVTATYDKGDPVDVTNSASFTGYNMSIAGDYTVTVSYGGKSVDYDISVIDIPSDDLLYSATFTEVGTHGYTQNKEFTLNGKDWVASVSQVQGGVFYLGCNGTNTAKGILNDNSNFSDVVTVLSGVDKAYADNVGSAHAYAMRLSSAYENVGSIEFAWAGGNNAFQVYIFGNRGSGLESLASTNYASSGATTSGFVKWDASEYGENFSEFVVVARPGATTSTATAKTLRAATFKIFEGDAEPVDPSKKDMVIYASGNPASGESFLYSENAGAYTFSSYEESELVSGVTWSVSDETVATIDSSTGAVTTLKPGDVTIYAEAEGYKKASASVHFIAGDLETLSISGSMSKTDYLSSDSWNPNGFAVEGHYASGWTADVTNQVDWTYNPETPAEGVTSVVATATIESIHADSDSQAVTVTVAHAGTAEDPFTVAEALAKAAEIGAVGNTGEGPWVTKGIISRVTSAPAATYWNATYYISDDGSQNNELQVYRGFYLNNTKFDADTAKLLTAGKIVTITGNLTGSYGSEYCQGNYLLALEEPDTGDVDVTFAPELTSYEIGASGTFSASSETQGVSYSWLVDDSSVLTVDANTGEFEAVGLGVARVTVTASKDDKEGFAFADITVNGNAPMTVSEANAIASSLASGKITSYYIYVKGYVAEFATSYSSGDSPSPRAIDICDINESDRIMVYTNVNPYASFIDGLELGTYVVVKATVQNYSGTFELTSPEKVDSSYSALQFAHEFMTGTDAICSTYEDGDDNSEALGAIWDGFATKFNSLSESERAHLENDAGCGSTIVNAMKRYDYLVGRYSNLDAFVQNRVINGARTNYIASTTDSAASTIIIVVVALTSITSIGVLLVIKRRRTLMK